MRCPQASSPSMMRERVLWAAVVYAVADRLAQAEGEWLPFDRSGWRSLIYPDPHR